MDAGTIYQNTTMHAHIDIQQAIVQLNIQLRITIICGETSKFSKK